jgi:hypothetical protein
MADSMTATSSLESTTLPVGARVRRRFGRLKRIRLRYAAARR